jgi:hypothetical protein
VFINQAWNDTFPASSLASASRDTSDHVPLMATISSAIPKGGFFRYEPSWGLHSRFRQIIRSAWGSNSRADATARVVARLRLCRNKCKTWARRISPCSQRETDCRLLISLLDVLEEGRPCLTRKNCFVPSL